MRCVAGGPPILHSSAPPAAEVAERPPTDERLFLPDFCAIPVVFSVVIIGELLAFVVVLLGGTLSRGAEQGWRELALASLFVQWVGLASAAALCRLRPWLARRSAAAAGLLSYAVVLVATALTTEAGFWLIRSGGVTGAIAPDAGGPGGHLELLARNVAVSAIVTAAALRYFYVQHQWRRQVEREAQARIQALHSRIRPHFLFNSMNTIASLTRRDPALAETVVEDLAELFRMSLGDARVPVTLGRELELCRHYLRIEALRLGPRLREAWDVAGLPEDALLPGLTLQPLLENAIYHGIEPSPDGGLVAVRGWLDGDDAVISLSNTCPRPARASVLERPGNRMAMRNVAERLAAYFGPRASLEARPHEGGYEVILRLPVTRSGPGERAEGGG